MGKQKRLAALASIGILTLMFVFAASPLFTTRATTRAAKASNKPVTTINGLARISVVGSTAFIVDATGKTIAADANPYGVAIAPSTIPASNTPGALKAGDIVVTNIGSTDTGTTLVRFPAKMGPGQLFDTVANPGTKGPQGEAFNTKTGNEWVANVSGNNVQVFKPTGGVLLTITNPLFKKPYGLAFNRGTPNQKDGSVGAFFSTNLTDATIDRIEIIPGHSAPTFRVSRIGQLAQMGQETEIAVTWVPSLRLHGKMYSDVLLATDKAMDRIAAYPNSSTRTTTTGGSTDKGITAFQGLPLRTPGGFDFNPLNGDLLVANLDQNDLVELNLSLGRVVAIRTLDNVPVDKATGTGSALVGIAASIDAKGNLEVFFIDDNTNTLDVLSV